MRRPFAQPLTKFFADRGPHLAAMIAYFGLLSSVSLIFLALALLGFTGRADESSYLVEELQRLFPSQSINDIVRVVETITSNATTLGLIGGRVPRLDVALALQRARVRVQHRLRAAEPLVPARQGPRDRSSWPAR